MKIKQHIQAEKDWHKQKFYVDNGHWTSHPFFASRERHWLKNDVEKGRFYGTLYKFIRNKPYRNNAKVLFAPVGNGGDYKYLQGIYREVHGIDISAIALSDCPASIVIKENDILSSGYEDESFDVLICSLFLHHVQDTGLEPFIKEYFRLLRKGGTLAIIEPSSMYPLSLIFKLLTIIMGNVTGKVEGERPVFPYDITRVLRSAGFRDIYIRGLTFNHVRFPVFVQTILNLLDFPFRFYSPFNLFAESIGWYCEKP